MKAKLTLDNGTTFSVTVDEKELEPVQSGRWKPEEGEEYWYVGGERIYKCGA